MAWVKAFHIVFTVTWFAGLFYLPRLFVYHSQSTDAVSTERFKLMEHRLYYRIATPGGALAVIFGLWLLLQGWAAYAQAGWMQVKLALVAALIAYHVYLGKLLQDFKYDRNRHGHVYYRWLNEFPLVILIGAVILVEVQPF